MYGDISNGHLWCLKSNIMQLIVLTVCTGLSTKDLLDRIVVLLADSSPLTVRLALVALRSCVHLLLNSVHASLALRALLVALEHVGNSYWLVKVC